MSQLSTPPKGSIHLPHGAWLMRETGLICVPTGNVLLKFQFDEFSEFASIIDDISTVLSSNMRITTHVCESCGTELDEVSYEEPEGEDLQ
jgi:uncharacterized protein with PIN domain